MPTGLGRNPNDSIVAFNKAIIDSTKDLVCCYKPQIAFYAALGAEKALQETINYIRQVAPDVPVILDAKRGDIASTAQAYATEVFDRYQVDAVTVNPYLGSDSVLPFTSYTDRGVVILCKTSNASSGEIQDLVVGDLRLYEHVAKLAVTTWNNNRNILLVVGATYPKELVAIRQIVGDDCWFLVPGVGSQGASAADVVQNGANRNGEGLIISSSRGIIYAKGKPDFQSAARAAATELLNEIREAQNAFPGNRSPSD